MAITNTKRAAKGNGWEVGVHFCGRENLKLLRQWMGVVNTDFIKGNLCRKAASAEALHM